MQEQGDLISEYYEVYYSIIHGKENFQVSRLIIQALENRYYQNIIEEAKYQIDLKTPFSMLEIIKRIEQVNTNKKTSPIS